MTNQETLQKLQPLHLMMADEIKRICEKYHIRYFMIAGALLGAVRHGGFIPWDDDMDFGMPRKDFEYFLKVCETELNHNIFYLQTDRKEKFYPFNFAKLSLKGTRVVEEFSDNANVNQCIYIDIFPIDVVPDNKIKKWIQFHAFYVARNLLWVKCGYGEEDRKKEASYKIARFVSRFFTVNFLKKVKHITISRYAGEKSKYVVTSDGNYGLKKETLKRKWIENISDYQFEDRVYPGIADYNEYLTYFYGDYMKEPPENDRNHHDRVSVDFGKYISD